MLLEIQRTVVLSIFFYIFIQAQDFGKNAVNTGATDPFAKPNVNPFGNMMADGNAKSKNQKKSQVTVTRTIVKTDRKSGNQGTINQPVVGGGTVKTSKTTTSTVVKTTGGGNARTIGTGRGTNKVTKTITKDQRIRNNPALGRQNRVKTRTSTETKTVTINTNNAGPTVSVSKDSKTVVRKSGNTVERRPIRKFAAGDGPSSTRTVTTVVRKSGSSDGIKPVRNTAVRTVTTTRKSNTGTGQTTKEIVKTSNINRNRIQNTRGVLTGGNTDTGKSSITRTSVTRGSGETRPNNRQTSSRGGVTGGGTNARKTQTTTITRTSVRRGLDGTRTNNRNTIRGGISSTNLDNVMNFGTVKSKTEKPLNSLPDFNTERIYETERNNRMSTGPNNAMITNIETIEAREEQPVTYKRILYEDQSICDTCNTGANDCHLTHPGDCTKFIRCLPRPGGNGLEALIMNCSFGTFWSEEANTCDLSQDVDCKNDACRNPSVKTYPSGINCRSYWKCENGRSRSECCPNGKAYRNGECVFDEFCLVDDGECPFRLRQKEEVPKQACGLEKVPEDITAFRMKNSWTPPQYCAPGTVFDENECTCVKGVFTAIRCTPNADLNFTANSVYNMRKNHIDLEHMKFGNGYGEFNGRASIAIPYYNSNENYRRSLVIRIRFWHNGKGYDSQVLASNCRTRATHELSPSFAILLARNSSQIMFFASTKTEDRRRRYGSTATIKLKYVPEKWTVVEMRWLDEVLYGRVETLESDGTSKVSEDKQTLKGTLQKSVMPLMVGNCNMNDGFVGFIDQVVTYACDPGRA